MDTMFSSVKSIPLSTLIPLKAAKKGQDEATAKLASDLTGVVGVGDIDMSRFLTKPFTGLRMFQVASGAGVYGTLVNVPTHQMASNDNPFYSDGKVMALDRAGLGAFAFNILRTGKPPDGYGKGVTKIVQKRVGLSFNPAISRLSYYLTARVESADYVMQADERLDGDFFPGSIQRGVSGPYGQFDTSQYNGDPFTADGWTGVPHAVPNVPANKPTITAITPTSVTRPNTGGININLTGTNFTNCGFSFIGPYLVSTTYVPSSTTPVPDPPGAYYYRNIQSDTLMTISTPGNMQAGTYTIYVIGQDGQIGSYSSFTVNPGPGE